MVCVATFNSHITFNLKIYPQNTLQNFDECECAEFEVKRFGVIPRRIYRKQGFKGFYKKLNKCEDYSSIVSFNDLKRIVINCRNLDIQDNYNYKYTFVYNNGKIRLVSRTQIENMYFTPNKSAVYYLNNYFCKINLNLGDNCKKGVLLYSIIANNINKCSLNMALCNDQLIEYSPDGLFINVSSCAGTKNILKFIRYAKLNLCGIIRILSTLKFRNTYFKNGINNYNVNDIECALVKTEYDILTLAQANNINNAIDLTELLTGSIAQEYYINEYEYLENIAYGLVWNDLISKPEDIRHIDMYDILTLVRNESIKDIVLEKIKQNKKAEIIAKKIKMPVLFNALGNIIK